MPPAAGRLSIPVNFIRMLWETAGQNEDFLMIFFKGSFEGRAKKTSPTCDQYFHRLSNDNFMT
jgi:hypothetical protein